MLIPQSAYGRLAEDSLRQSVSARRRSGGGARDLPAERRERHARAGAAGRERHQVGAGRCPVPAGGARGPPVSCAAPCLERRDQQEPAIPRHRAMGLSPISAARRRWSAAGIPAPDPKGWSKFVQSYSKTYGAAPPRIASLAYDAVSLAVSLSANPPGQRYTTTQLTRRQRLSGVDGLFRLLPDGTSERGLAILEVRADGPQVIEPAPAISPPPAILKLRRRARRSAGRARGGLCRVAASGRKCA